MEQKDIFARCVFFFQSGLALNAEILTHGNIGARMVLSALAWSRVQVISIVEETLTSGKYVSLFLISILNIYI